MWTRIGMLLAAVIVSFVLTGAGQVAPEPRSQDPAAAHAVAVLAGLEDGDIVSAIPADFADTMGYRPAAVTDPDGSVHVVDPEGGCSWLGSTSFGFDRACRTHDVGYDLLRYATARGGELGPWARTAIDDRLGAQMRERCDDVGGGSACEAVARLSETAVALNSWRQGYGNPGDEQVWPYIVSAVLIVCALVGPAALRRIR